MGLVALMAWVGATRWIYLVGSERAFGVDSYALLVGLRSLLAGSLYVEPGSALVVYLLAPLAMLVGPMQALKAVAIAASVGAAIPLFLLGRRIGDSPIYGLAAATMALTSAGSFHVTVDLVAFNIAITCALSFLAALAWALESRRRWRVLLAVLWLFATAAIDIVALLFCLGRRPRPLCRRAPPQHRAPHPSPCGRRARSTRRRRRRRPFDVSIAAARSPRDASRLVAPGPLGRGPFRRLSRAGADRPRPRNCGSSRLFL